MAVVLVYFLTPRKTREEVDKASRASLASLTWDPRNASKMFIGVNDFADFEVKEPNVRSTEVAAEGGAAWAPRFSLLCSAKFRRVSHSERSSGGPIDSGTTPWQEGLQVTRSEDDFRCLRASLLQKYCGAVLGPLPEVCHIMRKYYKTPQIISSTQRDYQSFINSCLSNDEIRVDAEFLTFLLVGQAEWQKHFKKPIPGIDLSAAMVSSSLFQVGDHLEETSDAEQELYKYQQFLTTTSTHLKTLQSRSVELIERGQPGMSENKAGYDLVVGPRSTDAMSMSSMLGQLESLRAVTISSDHIGSGHGDQSAPSTLGGAWFGFKERARSNGQAKHTALLALYFETSRVSRWVDGALYTMQYGASYFHELLSAQRAHTLAMESQKKRMEHEQAAMKNEQQVEKGEGGLAVLTMTYFHGLSALSHATDDQCQMSKESVETALRIYEQWKHRSMAMLKTVCDAVARSIEELTHRWVVMERNRYTAQASALTEMAKSTKPILREPQNESSEGDGTMDVGQMMSDAAVEALESEVWHD
jgi:hypothetical protein